VQHVSIAPKWPLAEFVERFWYSCDAPPHQKVRVVPSGTIELVFNLNEDELGFYDTEQPERCKTFSGAIFSGAHARPLFVETRKHVVGVHFKPGGAFRFLGVPATEFTDTHVNVKALWGKSTADLREQLCAAVSPGERFRVLEDALSTRLANAREEHRAVRAALDILRRDAGEARTRDLAEHLGLSQRHFIKVFAKQVGVTPKVFGRMQRFQRAADLTRSSAPDWADVAVACGYFDQSHLIHDFQTFSGLSPTEFHRQRGERLLGSAPLTPIAE
jgi:AraC-like DNA-binding protein